MANFQEHPCYSLKMILALSYTADLHSRQIRKTGNIPYLGHLLQVAGLVMEAGGSEDETIAALLHDAVEDIGIDANEIPFSPEVKELVMGLTEKAETPVELRKKEYVRQVREGSPSVRLISCADKLHNLRGYATTGHSLWSASTKAFYDALMPVYRECDRVPSHWLSEMDLLLHSLDLFEAVYPKQD